MGEYETAVTHLSQALALAREVSDRHNEYMQLASLGNAYYAMGQLEMAIDYYEPALILSLELNIDDQNVLDFLSRAHRETGLVYEAIGEFDAALTHLQRALQLFEEINSPLVSAKLELAKSLEQSLKALHIKKSVEKPC
jgi:tetratricopeptide (TPR) repeat protein